MTPAAAQDRLLNKQRMREKGRGTATSSEIITQKTKKKKKPMLGLPYQARAAPKQKHKVSCGISEPSEKRNITIRTVILVTPKLGPTD